MRKRILSLLLCVIMLFSLCPQSALAVGNGQTGGVTIGTSGLCEHHPEHDADCGYTEGTAGTSCGHEHTEDCYVEVTNCVHEHDEGCYPEESVSGNEATPSGAQKREPENCPHICDEESGCITKELNCQHEHDGECGYSPAIEGTPCGYVCELCGGEDNGEAGKQPEAECICTTLCTTEAIEEDCPVCGVENADLTLCEGEAKTATPSNAEAITVALAADPVTDVSYLDETGTSQTCASATKVTDSVTAWSNGWYVVTGDVTIGTEETPLRVTVSGDVHLILTDGCTLTVNGGIRVEDDDDDITNGSANALTIYAQSTDESTMGKLIAKGAEYDDNAAIGGYGDTHISVGGSGGAITINGGNITASSYFGAGIGGGYGDHSGGSGGAITITGGVVKAESSHGAGIGGGYSGGDGGSGGKITITGGSVIATGVNGAGIGGGQGDHYGGSGGEITITGGVVKAESNGGAAIGGGYSGGGTGGDGGKITITGGNTTASGYTGTAIGGGYGTNGGSGGEVTITGGTVTATGNASGNTSVYIIGVEGIGGGRYDITSGTDGTFQTTNNGNAVIFASPIGDQSGKTSNAWHGIIFEGDAAGIIYGESVAPTDDFTIPTGKTLTIPDGVTMTVNSRITVNGTLANNGTIIGSGSITPEEKKLTYKAAPSTPVIVSVSADSITLQPIVGETAVEYSKDNTKWQSETTFSGLTAATSYTFYARYQANGFYKGASPQSDGSTPTYIAYYTVTLNTNGGTINSGNVTGYTYGQGATLPTADDMTYTGHTFKGWYDNKALTGNPVTEISDTETGNKEYWAKWEANTYTVTLNGVNSDATGAGNYAVGVTVNIYAGTKSGYSFNGWTSDNVTITNANNKNASFIMPAKDVAVTANWTKNSSGGTGHIYYTIKATAGAGGTISPSGNAAVLYGRNKTFTITPDNGYAIADVKIDGQSIGAVKTYTFERVKGDHTIEAVFMKATGNPQTGVDVPFTDVSETDWFYEDVAYVYTNNLMNGTSTTMFSPNTTTTRGMIVTILYRLEGEPSVSDNCHFADVKSGSYYEKAITWAAAKGIVSGYGNNQFGPDDPITREQMAVILFRYAQYKGLDVSAGEDTNILSYSDALDISEYAFPAMQWICGESILNGSDGNLMPRGSATRAQVAAILHRFCENILK